MSTSQGASTAATSKRGRRRSDGGRSQTGATTIAGNGEVPAPNKSADTALSTREARNSEEAQGAEDWVLPTRHFGCAGPHRRCLRPRPPCTRCGRHPYPTRHLGAGHPDPSTKNRRGTTDLDRSRIHSQPTRAGSLPARNLPIPYTPALSRRPST
jgi:hypothetical protein